MNREEKILDAALSLSSFMHPLTEREKKLVLSAMRELARERAIGVLEYVRTRAITGNDGTWHIETDYGFSQSLTNAELYDLFLSQLNK